MAITLSDAKVLWGRAGARCSNPACRADLTQDISGAALHMGEMAHLIAHSAGGPRGDGVGKNDGYGNLILLCTGCHTLIDKAPDAFPEDLLRQWKAEREEEVQQAGEAKKYDNLADLKREVGILLAQNKAIFESVGPKSKIAELDPASDAVDVWELRKVDSIVPNNATIVRLIGSNMDLLDREDINAFALFKEHAQAFSDQQLGGARREYYPLFPKEFSERFSL